MENKKQYLVMIEQEKNVHMIKLAYWMEERKTKWHTYETGFYHSHSYYYPYKNVIGYTDIPDFTTWNIEEPIEGERYLVYRTGNIWCGCAQKPHYTIRKYHRGYFGSTDVKYWLPLSKIISDRTALRIIK